MTQLNINKIDRYPLASAWIHWICALLIIGMIMTGLAMEEAPNDLNKINNLRIHVILGIVVSILSVFRIFQHNYFKKKQLLPKAQDSGSKLINTIKSIVHLALRNMMMGLAITGFLTILLSDYIELILSANPAIYERINKGGVFTAHAILSKIYLLLFILHLAGIGRYIILKRKNILKRISLW